MPIVNLGYNEEEEEEYAQLHSWTFLQQCIARNNYC